MEKTEKESINEFLFDYLQKHDFVSKIIVSGMYIDRMNPKSELNEDFDEKQQQKYIKNKISSIFTILKHLGIIENFSKTTIRVINKDKLNSIGLDKLLTLIETISEKKNLSQKRVYAKS